MLFLPDMADVMPHTFTPYYKDESCFALAARGLLRLFTLRCGILRNADILDDEADFAPRRRLRWRLPARRLASMPRNACLAEMREKSAMIFRSPACLRWGRPGRRRLSASMMTPPSRARRASALMRRPVCLKSGSAPS